MLGPERSPLSEVAAFQRQIAAFVRAFGLHQPEHTPCGQPIPVSETHALMEPSRDEPLPQHELRARLQLEKSSVSRLVGQLEARGRLTRSRRDGDGQVVWLELTPPVATPRRRFPPPEPTRSPGFWKAVPEDKRATVLDSLSILVEALRDHH